MTTDAVLSRRELIVPGGKWHRLVALVLAAATMVAGVVTVLGMAPWLFLAVYALTGTYLLAPLAGWGRAAWSTTAVALFATSWVLVVDPLVDVRLDIATVAVLTLLVVVGLAWTWVRQARSLLTLPPFGVVRTIAIMLPAAVSTLVFYGLSAIKGMPLAWAMQGDAQFNTVLSRQFGVANGELSGTGQVLSLAQGLMAIVHLPGREGVATDDLLTHDITRQANLWVLMILVSSVLAGAISDRVLRGASWSVRTFGTIVAAGLPLTWHLTGYAMSSGFYNASIAFLAIELAFYFWLVLPASPLVRSSISLALTVVMLEAWTPMAVIPGVLAAVAAWQGFKAPKTRISVIVWTAAVAQLALFVLLFVLPGFLAKSSVLSVTGTILPLNRYLYLAVTVALILAATLLASASKGAPIPPLRHFGLGAAMVAISAALGTGFLIFQNRHLPDYWIYYPIKFAWISMEMLLLLLYLAACLFISRMQGRRPLVAAASVSAAVILFSVLQLNPTPPTIGTLPLVSVVKDVSPGDVTVPLLSSVSGERVFFYWYMRPDQDTFMNQWQFQITAKDEYTPIREFAYRGVNSVGDACDAAKTWGGDVRVITSSVMVAKSLTEACGDHLTAVVRAPLR